MKKISVFVLVFALMSIIVSGCSNGQANVSREGAEAVEVKQVYVSPQWVKSVIDENQKESENYVILEAGWGPAKDNADYKKGHLPGAVYADISKFEDEPYWNVNEPKVVEKEILNLGVTKDTVVILNGTDISGTSRLAYIFLWAGVENVKVLNGGLSAWTEAGYDAETKANEATAAADFGVSTPAHSEYMISIEETAKRLENDSNFSLVSIRSYDEFIGKTSGYTYIDKAGEPKGAIWGKAGSDPYHMEEYTHEDGTVITMDELKELWKDTEVDLDKDLAFYCGTGWRATIPFLIMYESGYTNIMLYDGGWFQWQLNNDLPVQVGDPTTDKVEFTSVGKLPNDKAAK